MDETYEQRRIDLLAFVRSIGRGAIARISKEADIDASYLSRCLYPPGKDGKKNIGDEIATRLDRHFPQWRGAESASQAIYTLRVKTEREKALDELMQAACRLDISGIHKLTERAAVLLEQHAVKETLSSSA